MATVVLAHGAWSAAWAWKKMRPLFRTAGHEFFSPTYTGLGERAHLARPDIDLSTHVQDVLAMLEIEDLTQVTLPGHSYGGMVATGVADKAPGRIARVVYIDAFAPKDGQSLFDLLGPKGEARMRAGAAKDGDGWKLPLNPMPADTSPEDGPGPSRSAGRSRSRPSRRRSSSPRASSRRAITSMRRRTGRATCSVSSPSVPRASQAGPVTRSTPATTRTSPAPMC